MGVAKRLEKVEKGQGLSMQGRQSGENGEGAEEDER